MEQEHFEMACWWCALWGLLVHVVLACWGLQKVSKVTKIATRKATKVAKAATTVSYLSRTSENKRANSPQEIRLSMAKWLHFCRDQIFYPTNDGTGVGSTGETGDNEVENGTEQMEDEAEEGQDNPSLYQPPCLIHIVLFLRFCIQTQPLKFLNPDLESSFLT